MNDLVSYDQQWAEQAKQVQREEPQQAGGFLTIRGGILKYGDDVLPGNQACVVVIDAYRENTYYPGKYDPENASPPACYAFGRGPEPMFPHESMQAHPDVFQPQHVADGEVKGCEGCPRNEWGSAETGRGKACKNRRRLICLPAGYFAPRKGSRDFDLELFTDPDHFATADTASLKLPVTSGKNWAKYVNQVAATTHRPFFGVFTRVYVEPDPKSQYRVMFEMVDLVPNELAEAVMSRHEAEAAKPFEGYQPPSDED